MPGITGLSIHGARGARGDRIDDIKNAMLGQKRITDTENLCENIGILKQRAESDLQRARERLRQASEARVRHSVNSSNPEKKIVSERIKGHIDKLTVALVVLDNAETFDNSSALLITTD